MVVIPNIEELVTRFQDNEDAYMAPRYNEAQVRHEFIDPMFRLLGWDVDNAQGYAEAYKDVVHEDTLKIGETSNAPDYAFRIGGVRKFFLEAKKPSVNISDDVDAAYQLRRYAWSAKLPISILTNFRTFAVYGCRIRPEKTDKPGTARVTHMRFHEYIEKWKNISSTFSRLSWQDDHHRSSATEDRTKARSEEGRGRVLHPDLHRELHIVSKTIAPLLEGTSPAQALGQDRRVKNARPFRILDPACGSGSFLIQAYQFLLDWYRDAYVSDGPEKYAKGRNSVLHMSPRGDWQLTIAHKKTILLTHIFGVDIDPQAVEVTKLSLLLKVLEGESGDALALKWSTRPLALPRGRRCHSIDEYTP